MWSEGVGRGSQLMWSEGDNAKEVDLVVPARECGGEARSRKKRQDL